LLDTLGVETSTVSVLLERLILLASVARHARCRDIDAVPSMRDYVALASAVDAHALPCSQAWLDVLDVETP